MSNDFIFGLRYLVPRPLRCPPGESDVRPMQRAGDDSGRVFATNDMVLPFANGFRRGVCIAGRLETLGQREGAQELRLHVSFDATILASIPLNTHIIADTVSV